MGTPILRADYRGGTMLPHSEDRTVPSEGGGAFRNPQKCRYN